MEHPAADRPGGPTRTPTGRETRPGHPRALRYAGLVALLAALTAIVVVLTRPAPPPVPRWDHGAYLGGILRPPGSDSERIERNVEYFEEWSRWTGDPPPTVYADFTSADDWDGVDGYPSMFEGYAALPPGTRINLGVPMLTDDEDTTLRRGAEGRYTGEDGAFVELATNVVRAGLGGRVIYRLGWEMNAATGFRWGLNGDVRSGNPSYGEGDPERGVEEFITYWRLIVEDIRSVDPDATFHFCPINGWDGTGPAPETMYPGDHWVDFVGTDVYDVDYSEGTYNTLDDAGSERRAELRDAAWDDILDGSHGLNFWREFAHDHDKLLGFGEWSTAPRADDDDRRARGGGDNPEFVERMHAFFSRAAREGVMGFDVRYDTRAHDGDYRFFPVSRSPYPRSAERYAELSWGIDPEAIPSPGGSPDGS